MTDSWFSLQCWASERSATSLWICRSAQFRCCHCSCELGAHIPAAVWGPLLLLAGLDLAHTCCGLAQQKGSFMPCISVTRSSVTGTRSSGKWKSSKTELLREMAGTQSLLTLALRVTFACIWLTNRCHISKTSSICAAEGTLEGRGLSTNDWVTTCNFPRY